LLNNKVHKLTTSNEAHSSDKLIPLKSSTHVAIDTKVILKKWNVWGCAAGFCYLFKFPV